MEAKITKLILDSFRGQDRTIEPGTKTLISGPNGSGKSTLRDAWYWLLLGKDAQGRSDYNVMSDDDKGHRGAACSVSADVETDESPFRWARTYKEKWTKKRGNHEASLVGHTTDLEIDRRPVRATKWAGETLDLDEATIRALSDPNYLGDLKWDTRRDFLISAFGELSQMDYLNDIGKGDLLSKRETLEDRIKILKGELKDIATRLARIPDLVKENQRKITETRHQNSIREEMEEVRSDNTHDLKMELLRAQRTKRAIVNKLEDLEGVWKRSLSSKIRQAETERSELAPSNNKGLLGEKARVETELQELRAEWRDLQAAKERGFVGDGTCPTCGQDLPKDQIEKAQKAFLVEMSAKIKDNVKAGGRKKERLDQVVEALRGIEQTEEKNKSRLDELTEVVKSLDDKLSKGFLIPKMEATGLDDCEEEISRIEASIENATDEDAAARIKELEEELSKSLESKRSKVRIEELKDEERELGETYQDSEGRLAKVESYLKAWIEINEDQINSSLIDSRVQLFELQINGGIKKVCKILGKNQAGELVEWGTLSTSEKIRTGLRLIGALQGKLGTVLPVWIDNAECVTTWDGADDIDGQVFYLEAANIKDLEVVER